MAKILNLPIYRFRRAFLIICICLLICAPQLSNAQSQLWGITLQGGPSGGGVLFKANKDGSNAAIVKEFTISTPGSGLMYQQLISGPSPDADKKLYGMTTLGGAFGLGTIFEYDPVTGNYELLHNFDGNGNGAYPRGNLFLYNNKFYGTTSGIDMPYIESDGILFEYDLSTRVFTRKASFKDEQTGKWPFGSLTAFNNKLYGMTSRGGVNDKGVLYEFDPNAPIDNLKKKFDFNDGEGTYPYSDLTVANDKLYGMTSSGGYWYGYGVIFEFDPAGAGYTKKVLLDDVTGRNPFGKLTMANGKLYGMTSLGGNNANGTLFEYVPGETTTTKIIDINTPGYFPPTGTDFLNVLRASRNLTLCGTKIYGTFNSNAGSVSGVSIFEFDPSNTTTFQVKGTYLTSGISQTDVFSGLTELDGKLYGTVNQGNGIIFEYDPATSISSSNPAVKKKLQTSALSFRPQGSLSFIKGKIYGTLTERDGYMGALYQIDPVTQQFKICVDESTSPLSVPLDLCEANGKLFGVSYRGGTNNYGGIFAFDPVLETAHIVYSFTSDKDKFGGKIVKAVNGKLYGITPSGGTYGYGAL